MGKFLDLMKATEADWEAETSADLAEGTYIFEFRSAKRLEDKDAINLYFQVRRPVTGDASKFRSDKYRPNQVQFNEKNTWMFVRFLKESGLTLNNVEQQLPKIIGKLYTGSVKHTKGQTPNSDGTDKIFVNLNDLKPYLPNAAPAMPPVTDDEDESID